MSLIVCAVMASEEGLDPQVAKGLRTRLLHIGPEQFVEENLSSAQMPARLLGTAFGINPAYEDQLGEDAFLRVLGLAIVRVYYKRKKLSQYNTIDDAASLLRKSKNIMVITGAGISTSLGIPDFRSKETGFYTKLQEMGISEPEEVFNIEIFDHDPSMFYELAADLLPDQKRYSPTHGFIRLLQDKSVLQTNYTQNIDNLEELAGIERHRLIQAHGSFATASCRQCRYKVKGTEIFDDIRRKRVAQCKRGRECIASQESARRSKKRKTSKHRHRPSSDDDDSDDDIFTAGVMKPDITFFGEKLPDDFFSRFTESDVKTVDLVLVIGTSLKVAPVSEMPNYLPHDVPHIYISREPIEHVNFDIQLLGDCDHVVFELCRRAGWELKHRMIQKGFRTKVEAVEDSGYKWTVKREEAKSPEKARAKVEGPASRSPAKSFLAETLELVSKPS